MFLLATILLKFSTRGDFFARYRKEDISTQITQKGLIYSARDFELGIVGYLVNNEGPFCSVSTSARFNVIVGNPFLGIIVPKASIKDQFVPLEIHNSEQLVFSLTKKDHCVPSPYESTFQCYTRERIFRNNFSEIIHSGPVCSAANQNNWFLFQQ